MYLKTIFQLIGGLGIFLYGMENMSSNMQKIAGPRLKKILSTLTDNRILGVFLGFLVTAFVQSSSVSTVMTIGFVNASLLTLKQALGIILGANIGTTVTGWILVLNIGKYGLPIVGLAGIFYLFSKKEKVKTYLMLIMGFGFIFLGLQFMTEALSPLKNSPDFIEIFKLFRVNSYVGLLKVSLIGAFLTAIIQSSSATIGITITLTLQGFIDYPTAVALVLGENVGTTITALIASFGAKANAKRAAYAHTLINIIGVLWATSIFRYYLEFLSLIVDPKIHLAASVAAAHTIFNVLNVLLLTPLIGYIDKFLMRIVKDDENFEVKVTHLNPLLIKFPNLIIEQTKIEIKLMGGEISESFLRIEEILHNLSKIKENSDFIERTEEKLDLYEKEIYDYNFKLLNGNLNDELIEDTRINLLVCDEYETIGDYQRRISQSFMMLYDNSIEIDTIRIAEIQKLHNLVFQFYFEVNTKYELKNKDIIKENINKYTNIKLAYKEARRKHFTNCEEINSRLNSAYLDITNYYRRIADHTYNIIEYFMNS